MGGQVYKLNMGKDGGLAGISVSPRDIKLSQAYDGGRFHPLDSTSRKFTESGNPNITKVVDNNLDFVGPQQQLDSVAAKSIIESTA